jgi:hypothetical protein
MEKKFGLQYHEFLLNAIRLYGYKSPKKPEKQYGIKTIYYLCHELLRVNGIASNDFRLWFNDDCAESMVGLLHEMNNSRTSMLFVMTNSYPNQYGVLAFCNNSSDYQSFGIDVKIGGDSDAES